MALLAIVMTLVLSLFTSFTTNFTRERAATDSVNIASSGMNEITRVTRAGTIIERESGSDLPVFVEADDESVILYSYLADNALDPAPIRVQLEVEDDRRLFVRTWDAERVGGEWVFPDLVEHPDFERVLARMVRAPSVDGLITAAHPLFTYLTTDGIPLSTPVNSANLGNIATVSVELVVQADITDSATPYRLHNRVGIPNLTDSRMGLAG